MSNINKKQIPETILEDLKTLSKAGFEAYLVGGCVRDLMLHKKPKDWDIATNATPEEIQELFTKTVYENSFGTVAIVHEDCEDETLKIVEITPYRLESQYSDKRHPDSVEFTKDIREDLKRRDFTVNAMAIDIVSHETIDPFSGQEDLKNGLIKAVGDPDERFKEDALRILRAVRLTTQLSARGGPASGWKISPETEKSIKKHVDLLDVIAKERIKDEFVKIIMSEKPSVGIEKMRELGILKYVIPELEDGYGIEQGRSHKFDVWKHNLGSLDHAAKKEYPLEIRLSALLHDIGKPVSRRKDNEKNIWTFYGHEVVGAKITAKVLSRLKFPKKTINLVTKFVRYHLFFSDTEKITLSAVRRTIRNMGPDHIWDLMKVRFCDRIGMGRPKESPYRLRKYESMIEEAMRSPLSVTMLNIDGNKIVEILGGKPGPKVGQILHILLEETIDNPEQNNKGWLEKRAGELGKLSEKELKTMGEKAKGKKEELEESEIEEIRKKWWVK